MPNDEPLSPDANEAPAMPGVANAMPIAEPLAATLPESLATASPKAVVEALIFASKNPLSTKEISAALQLALDESDEAPVVALAKLREGEIQRILEELADDYRFGGRAFQLVEQASGWVIVTRPDYALWIRQLYPEAKPARLSSPSLETLALIAYRQPITRADIEAVRGVAVDTIMHSLQERGLIKIAGRADAPGRPLLYATTEVFMQHFGLKTLDELPNVDELRHVHLPSATPEGAPVIPLDDLFSPTGKGGIGKAILPKAAARPAAPAAEPEAAPAAESAAEPEAQPPL